MQNKTKFTILSFLIIILPFFQYFIDENFILDSETIFWSVIIAVGTFNIIQNSNKYGLILWIGGFAGPRIFYSVFSLLYVSEYNIFWYQLVLIICQLAFCLCICRLALQWSSSLWFKTDKLSEKSKNNLHRFWILYIELEKFLMMGISIVFTQLIATSLKDGKPMGNHLINMIPIWCLYAIYKQVKQTSLRILSPIGIKVENEELNADIENTLQEEFEFKDSLNKILSTSILEDLKSVYHHELQKFPHKESIISKAYKKQKNLINSSTQTIENIILE